MDYLKSFIYHNFEMDSNDMDVIKDIFLELEDELNFTYSDNALHQQGEELNYTISKIGIRSIMVIISKKVIMKSDDERFERRGLFPVKKEFEIIKKWIIENILPRIKNENMYIAYTFSHSQFNSEMIIKIFRNIKLLNYYKSRNWQIIK